MANKKRLIDANALTKLMCRACNNECCEEPCEPGECFIYDAVNNAPTVDAVEVVHGRWRVSRASEISKTVWCTACGEEIYIHKNDTLKIDRMPYCPNCGAKMDGDGNG